MDFTFKKFKALTRIEQSLFGLPFVMTGSLLAFPFNLGWHLLFIIPAFFAARISGMAFNQLIDRKIDRLNPRTKNRPIPSSHVTVFQARFVAIGALLLFILFCFFINKACFYLFLFASALLAFYSYMKRLHFSCHFVLGAIHFLGPVAAFVALKGTFSLSVILCGLVAFFSIAASDIIYAIQDLEFDVKQGLQSIPAHFGKLGALKIAKICHGLALIFLIAMAITLKLGAIFYIAPLMLCFIYWCLYKRTELFFFSTVFTSISIFLFILIAMVWRG